jgi:hypothetical protein
MVEGLEQGEQFLCFTHCISPLFVPLRKASERPRWLLALQCVGFIPPEGDVPPFQECLTARPSDVVDLPSSPVANAIFAAFADDLVGGEIFCGHRVSLLLISAGLDRRTLNFQCCSPCLSGLGPGLSLGYRMVGVYPRSSRLLRANMTPRHMDDKRKNCNNAKFLKLPFISLG